MVRMNVNCILIQFILFSLVLFPFIGVTAADDGPVTITDDLGRTITLDKPADRIGYTRYNVAEAIKLIDAWDKVVARDGTISDPTLCPINPKFYPNLEKIPAISDPNDFFTLDYEKIMEIKPEVMIIPCTTDVSVDRIQEVIDTLEPEIPVVALNFDSPVSMGDTIVKLGQITGNEEEAQQYLDFYNEIYSTIKEKTDSLPGDEKPEVFLKMAGFTPDALYTLGKENDYWNQMIAVCGGDSISSDLSGAYIEVDKEWLINQDMDAIVAYIWDQYYPETFGFSATDPAHKNENGPKIVDEISAMDVFSQTEAVTNDDVFLLDGNLFTTPRVIVGMAYLAKWLHPELFNDLNPQEIHQKYLTQFIGADYNLNDVGLFGYP
ncbi:iron ABC transporter substrate-binding protein [Methanospirillum stamsii]|uniref:Iron ABC transporter substrate-binding protein n=1 Tax=Methanospirillum stamsii TaxID=1277351 RepID=A0A2V2NA85_9EURY|nr:iron ABC transporter substrate-binding protein [Methanospirillum stamsii]